MGLPRVVFKRYAILRTVLMAVKAAQRKRSQKRRVVRHPFFEVEGGGSQHQINGIALEPL